MKKTFNNFFAKASATSAKLATSAFGLLITTEMAIAQTGGLEKAKGVMETFKTELTAIIPTIAVIALLALGIGYATKFVEKDTFVRWAIGIIIAGSAAQLTALFFTPG